jgi:L-cysteine desulfidase
LFSNTIYLINSTELDATKFVLNIPQETIDHILANIKVNLDLQTDVVAEQYSLNVYRTGGMFKKHKDTPRGDDSE